ncbi:rCG35861 [Rattus norvegicus]|uniref:RCG35861 n=1 Tax=Rattus norvegicus TaxID=10116 RepID=A6IJD9_RAT|nr:rCG35861 [Rattus norvegicus]
MEYQETHSTVMAYSDSSGTSIQDSVTTNITQFRHKI